MGSVCCNASHTSSTANVFDTAMTHIAFTICNKDYLPYALECEASFTSHHGSEWRFLIFLVDHPRLLDEEISSIKNLLVNPASQVFSITEIFRESREISIMSLFYNITEFSTAVKPWIFDYLFEKISPETVTYIDPDIQFFSSLDLPLQISETNQWDCFVTPHILTDSLNSYQNPTLQNIRTCGAYNFGFIHFRLTIGSRKVVRFWKNQLVFNSLIWLEQNMFTDQRHGDMFPCLCRIFISRDPGLNVAYWNLQERVLSSNQQDQYVVRLLDGEDKPETPLTFFHFSGLRATNCIGISKYADPNPRSSRGANKTIDVLITQYADVISWHKLRLESLFLTSSADGISSLLINIGGSHASYLLSFDERKSLNEFFANRTANYTPPLPPSRFVSETDFVNSLLQYYERPLLNATKGLAKFLLHAQVDNRPDEDIYLSQQDSSHIPSTAQLNIVGYPNFSFGVGRITGLIINEIQTLGISFSFTIAPCHGIKIDDHAMKWVSELPLYSAFNPNAPTLFLINADQFYRILINGQSKDCFSRKCNIGYWWWELEKSLPQHFDASQYLDIVLAPTSFISDSLTNTVPTNKIQYAPLNYKQLFDSIHESSCKIDLAEPSRQSFFYSLGMDLDCSRYRYVILNMFDFRSCIERKNPILLVEIFSLPAFRDYALVLKSSNGESYPGQYLELIEKVSLLPNVFLVDQKLSGSQVSTLYKACDVYASPHRAEGLGLNIIEADAHGLPTVFTNYGGITEYPFYSPGPHLRCPFKLIPLTTASKVYEPYMASAQIGELLWAEPNRSAFAQALLDCILALSSHARLSAPLTDPPIQTVSIGEIVRDLVDNLDINTESVYYKNLESLLGIQRYTQIDIKLSESWQKTKNCIRSVASVSAKLARALFKAVYYFQMTVFLWTLKTMSYFHYTKLSINVRRSRPLIHLRH